MITRASGWNGHVKVWLGISQKGEDWCTVHHETNSGTFLLYTGPLDKHADPRGGEIPLFDAAHDPLKRE
jgi:hypothetical protein